MFTLNGLILSTLLIAFGCLIGIWYGNISPETNIVRPKIYLGVGFAVALLTSILVVIGVLHF